MGAGCCHRPSTAPDLTGVFSVKRRLPEGRPPSTATHLKGAGVLRSLRFSDWLSPPSSSQRHRPVVAALEGARDDNFGLHPLRAPPFANPWYGSERFVFDFCLGSTTITSPGIRFVLRTLEPTSCSGSDIKVVTLFWVSLAPIDTLRPVDNENIGRTPRLKRSEAESPFPGDRFGY